MSTVNNFISLLAILILSAVIGYKGWITNQENNKQIITISDYITSEETADTWTSAIRVLFNANTLDDAKKLLVKYDQVFVDFVLKHGLNNSEVTKIQEIITDKSDMHMPNVPEDQKRFQIERNYIVASTKFNSIHNVIQNVCSLSNGEAYFTTHYYGYLDYKISDIKGTRQKLEEKLLKTAREKADNLALELNKKIIGIQSIKTGALAIETPFLPTQKKAVTLQVEVQYVAG